MSIWKFIYCASREAKIAPAIITTIVLIIGFAYMIFQQTMLIQANLDVYSNVVAFGCYATIDRFLKASNELIVAYFIMLPFKITAEKIIIETIVACSPSSLLLMKENAYALKNAGLRASQSLVENGLNVISPIVLLVSRGAALGMHINAMQLLVVISCLSCVFFAGSAILVYDHRKKQILSKKQTEVEEQSRSLMTSIATLVINGIGQILPSWMIMLKKEEAIPSSKHDVIMSVMYGALEIATTGIPITLVWMLKEKDLFLPLYMVIQPMFWHSWYLFWTVKSLVVSTASWNQYAEFIDSSQSPLFNIVKPSDAAVMISIFGKSNNDQVINEVELVGPSGCGKTTLMRKIIAEICEKFMLGYILYIDQFAYLPSGQQIYEYFASAFPNSDVLPKNFKDELLKRAYQLNINNLVNTDTLHICFSNPSGGEKKRIIFLKYVLPILMNSSNVMIAFLDEVSAGLDAVSFSKVRNIIEEIKIIGVKVLSIDHHDHHGLNTLQVEVFKEIRQIPDKHSPMVLSFWKKMIVKFFPRVYHKEEIEDDIEQCNLHTEINVWAPTLGIKKPE